MNTFWTFTQWLATRALNSDNSLPRRVVSHKKERGTVWLLVAHCVHTLVVFTKFSFIQYFRLKYCLRTYPKSNLYVHIKILLHTNISDVILHLNKIHSYKFSWYANFLCCFAILQIICCQLIIMNVVANKKIRKTANASENNYLQEYIRPEDHKRIIS